jgi:hypothetical protein
MLINWCSDCSHLKVAIGKVNFDDAYNFLRPLDAFDFMQKLIDEYYKELERQELYN